MKKFVLFLCTIILFSFVGCQDQDIGVEEMPYMATDIDALFDDLQRARLGDKDMDERLEGFDDILVPVLKVDGYKIFYVGIYHDGRYTYEYIPNDTLEGKESMIHDYDRLIIGVRSKDTSSDKWNNDEPTYVSEYEDWHINFGTRSVCIQLPRALMEGKIKENIDIKEYIELEIYQITDEGVVKTGNLV